MNIKPLPPAVTAPKKRHVTFLTAALVSLLFSNPVQAQTLPTSFPQYPLQTGFGSKVPPNIMLILDDSGSMSWPVMPDDKYWINYSDPARGRTAMQYNVNIAKNYDNPDERSYTKNVIYYNPAVTYLPWRDESLPPSDSRMPNADFRKVSKSVYYLTDTKAGGTEGLDLRDSPLAYFYMPKKTGYGFDKYRIANSTASGSYNGGIVQRCSKSNCTRDSDWNSNPIYETPEYIDPDTKQLTRRSQQDELQNIANWFHYHSSRMKMTKAAVLEAFGQLDQNYRVGYDRLNSSKIEFPIKWNRDNGLFEGANRKEFFERIINEGQYENTPTRSALIRTGDYYKTDDPYKKTDGTMLSCRRNYAVLATDGAWNKDDGTDGTSGRPNNPNIGHQWPNLATIADYYYKTDLHSLPNNVPATSKPMQDNAKHQHMNLFAISIGVGGNLDHAPNPPYDGVGKQPWKKNPDTVKEKIDDMAYAASQGRGAFFLANNTKEFADALSEAFASMGTQSASATNTTSVDNRLKDELLNFTTSFNSGTWLGDVIASSLKVEAGKPIIFENGWKLSKTFGSGVNKDFSQRTVLTSFGGTAKEFSKQTITDPVFARSGGSDAVTVADNIDYLRGVSALEGDGKLRARDGDGNKNPIGDIVNSFPFLALDSGTLFVGANDGMLHALKADDGKVLFSYVPKGLNFEALASLSSYSYEHRFFVDGPIDVSTTKITPDKNILIGALGRGGRGVFALDVTHPETMGAAQVLWDQTTQDRTTHPNMGYVLGRLRIRQGNGDKTWALVPNGIESVSGKSVLFAYELDTDGNIIQTHELIADDGTNNGLMSLGMADINGDGKIDIVYGGDLKGNLWRWDFSTDTPGPATLLFNTGGQPITGGITNARNPVTEQIFVGFGTGRFLDKGDLPSEAPSIQSIYGMIDSTTTILDSELQEREIAKDNAKNKDDIVRAFEKYSELKADKKGWYIDLPANERVISDASMMGGEAMTIVSVIPPDPEDGDDCESTLGSGYINAINLFTGTSPIYKAGGGYFRAYDSMEIESGVQVTVGSVRVGSGMPTAPNVLCDDNNCQVVVEPGEGEGLITREGAALDATAVKPHRLQWRSLR